MFAGLKKKPSNPPVLAVGSRKQIIDDLEKKQKKLETFIESCENRIEILDGEIRSLIQKNNKTLAKSKIAEMKGVQKQQTEMQNRLQTIISMKIKVDILEQDEQLSNVISEAMQIITTSDIEVRNEKMTEALVDWRNFEEQKNETNQIWQNLENQMKDPDQLEGEFEKYVHDIEQEEIEDFIEKLNSIPSSQIKKVQMPNRNNKMLNQQVQQINF